MTIAIGLICPKQYGSPIHNPTIFLASDSQTTRGDTKSLDAQKINIVSFADCEIVIAQAGIAELADKAIEVIQRKAQNTKVDNHEKILITIHTNLQSIRY